MCKNIVIISCAYLFTIRTSFYFILPVWAGRPLEGWCHWSWLPLGMTSSSLVSSPPWRLGLGAQTLPVIIVVVVVIIIVLHYYLASRVWMEGDEVTEGENFIGEVGGVLTPWESLLSFLITFLCLFCLASFRFMSSCWLVSFTGLSQIVKPMWISNITHAVTKSTSKH